MCESLSGPTHFTGQPYNLPILTDGTKAFIKPCYQQFGFKMEDPQVRYLLRQATRARIRNNRRKVGNMSSSSGSRPRPSRQRTFTSCTECRRRKQKCNQAKDRPCNHCARRYPPVECVYENEIPHPSHGHLVDLGPTNQSVGSGSGSANYAAYPIPTTQVSTTTYTTTPQAPGFFASAPASYPTNSTGGYPYAASSDFAAPTYGMSNYILPSQSGDYPGTSQPVFGSSVPATTQASQTNIDDWGTDDPLLDYSGYDGYLVSDPGNTGSYPNTSTA